MPRAMYALYDARAFLWFAPVEYNKLPPLISQSPTLEAFKSRLKTYLFNVVYV